MTPSFARYAFDDVLKEDAMQTGRRFPFCFPRLDSHGASALRPVLFLALLSVFGDYAFSGSASRPSRIVIIAGGLCPKTGHQFQGLFQVGKALVEVT